MGFASDLLSGLTGFRDHLVTTAEEAARPALAAVEAHISRLLPLVSSNVLAAEDEAHSILHELYGKLAAEAKTELSAPAAPADPTPAPVPAPAPAEAPAASVDPTPAPTTEASSAPSSTPSASTEPPAAAAPDAPAAQ